jgi:hypothetical protein
MLVCELGARVDSRLHGPGNHTFAWVVEYAWPCGVNLSIDKCNFLSWRQGACNKLQAKVRVKYGLKKGV